ncbi:MAG: epoxide hydrolase family protein [Micromonosporaceae bacterium]
MEKFTIDVPEAVLADLRQRLLAARWPAPMPRPAWAYGTDPEFLRELVAYWADGFDWPAVQRRLNQQLPQFTADVQGQGLHFAHLRGQGPDPFPLVITHGWPSSFVEMERLALLLAEPDDPADAFDVVVPSLPGYGFSAAPPAGAALSARTASRWASLMVDVLGYQRFGAVGGDVGAGVTTRLGLNHADRVVGIHVDTDGVRAASPDTADLSPAERAYLVADAQWTAEHGGYAHLQGTRPGTLAFGLADSPVGLAAYLIEKYRAWSDCGGDVLRRFSRDDLLTMVTLYWVTGTIGSSFLPYYDGRHAAAEAPPPARVEVPVAVALWREPDLPLPPRELAERSLNVTRWTPMPRGGHFAASEEPELLADDIREFFRPLRRG